LGVNSAEQAQEYLYRLPYHWFPEERLKRFEREVKQRIIFSLIEEYCDNLISNYLDVGCGDGRWTSDIHEVINNNSLHSIGVDFSSQAIGFAKLISPHIEFQIQRGEDLPYGDKRFDLVTAIEVIEHVEDGKEEVFLHELKRVLQEDGLLILTTPSWKLRLTHHHYRHYSIERLIELIDSAGLSVICIRGQSIPCYGFRRKLRKRMNLFPVIWKFWRFSFRETSPEKSLNLIVAAKH
jgi:SAM-dependent methyltransferase